MPGAAGIQRESRLARAVTFGSETGPFCVNPTGWKRERDLSLSLLLPAAPCQGVSLNKPTWKPQEK